MGGGRPHNMARPAAWIAVIACLFATGAVPARMQQSAPVLQPWSLDPHICPSAAAARRPPAGAPAASAQGLLAGGLGKILGGTKGPYTNVSGPLCASLPAVVKGAFKALPAPAADALCPTLLDSPGASPCDLGAVIEWGLGSTSSKPLKCSSALQVSAGSGRRGGAVGCNVNSSVPPLH